MTSDSEFDSIKPYCGAEIEAASNRLCQSQEFLTLFSHVTKIDKNTIINILKDVRDRNGFQELFFGPAIQSLIRTTTDGVSVTGMELV
ncbi:MAG: glycerol acyltransferase, partial [Odoribacter sp.]|nr:glycerol acyltransferase [Odoribacter sp.]